MKRSNGFENNFGKKLKLDEDLDDIWGDDPDIDDIEDCILKATQDCEREVVAQQNTSIAPSYGAFKFNQPISSTQARLNESCRLAGENGTAQDGGAGLEQKLRTLLTVKEGEVSILRMQLKKTTERLEGEIARTQRELSEKLNVTHREKEEAVTKLDLKNLELANFKRKLLDVQKNATRDLMSQSISRSKVINNTVLDNVEKNYNHRLESVHRDSYPLKHITKSPIFKPSTEDRLEIADVFKNDGFGSAIGGENNEAAQNLVAHGDTKLEEIFPEIGVLLNCNEDELELRDDCTGKLVILFLQLLDEIWEYLRELDVQIKEDHIRRWDIEYLNDTEEILKTERTFFDPLPWCSDERGIRCRQLLALLAEIIPYNTYLRNYAVKRTALFKHQDCTGDDDDFAILNRIMKVIQKIGQMRKSSKFCGFLSAVCHFVCKIFQSDILLTSKLCDDLFNITREVIFSRPGVLVLNHVVRLLEQASIHKPFIEKLCRLPEHNGLIKKSKKGIFLINKDCCTFQVFSTLYRKCICGETRLAIAALKFVYNAFNSKARWLYCRENQRDDCLYEMCSLSVEVISAVLQRCDSGQDVKNVLELSIKVLRLISFNCYDLLERKVDVYGQYKNIMAILKVKCTEFRFSDYDVGTLEKIMKTFTEDAQHDDPNFKLPIIP